MDDETVMSGEESYLEMRHIDRDLKVILTSGFRENERVSKNMDLGITRFIQKPYTYEKLGLLVREVIETK